MSNVLSKVVCDFQLYCVTSSESQVFKTDLKSMAKPGSSINPNLSGAVLAVQLVQFGPDHFLNFNTIAKSL